MSTRETVATDTPARSATPAIESAGSGVPFGSFGSFGSVSSVAAGAASGWSRPDMGKCVARGGD
ncbi:hypothetical protein JCM10599A_00390 [Paraburkholderia kururiensis]